MPTYIFYDEIKNISWEEMMSIQEKEVFLSKNKYIRQIPGIFQVVASVMGQKSMKSDDGFKEVMSKIAESNQTSELAKTYGSKSIKDIKKRTAIEKWRKRRAADTSK